MKIGPWHYLAVFSTGHRKEIKSSGREYTHAWRVEVISGKDDAKPYTIMGFSRTNALAVSAIFKEAAFRIRANPKPRYLGDTIHGEGKILSSEVIEVVKTDLK